MQIFEPDLQYCCFLTSFNSYENSTLSTMKHICFCFFIFFSLSSMLAQGPIDGFMKKKGELDLVLGVSQSNASTFVGGDKTKFNFGFKTYLVNAFANYGITDRINVVGSLPFLIGNNKSNFQDASLFIKAKALEFYTNKDKSESFTAIAALGLSYPISNYEVLLSGAIGQRAKVIQPKISLQWYGRALFINNVIGYNHRFDKLDETTVNLIKKDRPEYNPSTPPHYLTNVFRLGTGTSKIYVDAWFEYQHTFDGDDFTPDVDELPQPYQTNSSKIGGSFIYSEHPNWQIGLSYSKVIAGKNVSLYQTISGNIIYKLF